LAVLVSPMNIIGEGER